MTTTASQNGLRHIFILAKFELQKVFFNGRGIISLAAFALIWLLILVYPIRSAAVFILDPSFKSLLSNLFGPNTVDQLFNWPVPELAIFWCLGLYLFPIFSIFISADQFASDKTRGTLRFITLRVSRNSLFWGRFLGSMALQILLLTLTLMATLLMAINENPSMALASVSSGIMIIINISIVILPYTALMAVLSLYAQSARQATVFSVILWILVSLVVVLISSNLPEIELIKWMLPGVQISQMLNTQGLQSLAYAPIPLVQTLILLIIGRVYIQRSAL